MKDLKKFKIIYLGTPEIAVKPLKKLVNTGFNVVAVFCQPDKEKGRGKKIQKPEVKIASEELGIITLQPKDKEELSKLVTEISPDLAIIFAYGMIIPQKIIESVPYGFLNIHPSLLPKFRGSTPVQAAILNGEEKTGVSIISLTKEVDAGPIVQQEELEVDKDDTTLTLGDKLSELGSNLIAEAAEKVLDRTALFEKQNEKEATFTKIIKKVDGKIDWNKSAEDLTREIRAYAPWPGSYTYWEDKLIKILGADSISKDLEGKNGQVIIEESNLYVIAGKETLKITKLQIEGRNPMPSKDFLNGFPEINKAILK